MGRGCRKVRRPVYGRDVPSASKAPYPLEAVRMLRKTQRDGAELQLAEARVQLAQAQSALYALTQQRDTGAAERSEQANARSGRGADLARAGAYDARLAQAARELAKHEQAAKAVVRERERAVRIAEQTLLEAYREQQLIERHHERFAQAEHKRRVKAEELEDEDLLASRRAAGRAHDLEDG
jgi:flagellar biosynthesis chaperone FliJ